MAVVSTSLTTDSDTTNATSYTTASISPSAGKLLTCAVAITVGAAPTPPITVTGCGVTWVEEVTTDITFSRATHIFRAMGTPTTGALTISGGGATISGCAWNVSEHSGIDTSGTNGSGAIAQNYSNRAPNASSASETFTSAVTAGNATYAAIQIAAQEVPTAGSGWTSMGTAQSFSAPTTGFIAEAASTAQQNITASWTSSVAAYVAGIEIKAGNAALSGSLDRTGSGTVVFTALALTASGTLARTGSGTVAFTPGFVTAAGSLARTGSGTTSFGGTPRPAATLAQTGSGSLSLSGAPAWTASLARTGSGTTTFVGVGTAFLDLTGSGTLTFTPLALAILAGLLARTGSGTTVFAPTRLTVSGSLARTGSGSVSFSGVQAGGSSLAVTGDGVLNLLTATYLQVWTGSTWQPRHAEVWTGTAWTQSVPVTVVESPGRLGR